MSPPRPPCAPGRRCALVALALLAATGCSSLVRSVPFEAPPKSPGVSTFVVYTRGGPAFDPDYLAVLDRTRVVGATRRNTWFHFQAPPGDHELMLVVPYDPDAESDTQFIVRRCGDELSEFCDGYRARWKVEQAEGRSATCYPVSLRTKESRRYFARLRYVAPAAAQTAGGAEVRANVAEMKGRAENFQAMVNARPSTAAEQQFAAQQGMNAAAGEAALGLADLLSDPDAPPGTVGHSFALVRDPKELGPQGVARLAEWERVTLEDPAAAQILYDRIRKAGPLTCLTDGTSVELVEDAHLD